MSFGCNRETLSWALIVDSVEMSYAFLNWTSLGLCPLCQHQWHKIHRKGGRAEKDQNKEEKLDSPANGLHRPVKNINQAFAETGFACSISTFIKYKPFYIAVATKRVKESCLCKKCLNAHLLLAGINNF